MAKGKPSIIPRVFLDSGVLLEGLLAPWGASRAVLILSRRKVFRIILAEYVQGEVEDNLLEFLAPDPRLGSETINGYSTLLRLLDPEFIPLPTKQEIDRHRHLIRHQTDVPVLVSALKAAPDWFSPRTLDTSRNRSLFAPNSKSLLLKNSSLASKSLVNVFDFCPNPKSKTCGE